jgi:dTDP-4-dehydrorhamnose reductase
LPKEQLVSESHRKKRLLVTGASGFLGWHICTVAYRKYNVTGVFNSRQRSHPSAKMVHCDLTDGSRVNNLFAATEPDAVIHAAAAADPNFCQQNPELSEQINIHASIIIAEACASRSLPCAFTSTDLVFNGTAPPYREDNPTAPVNLYGEQKVVAEQQMLSINPRSIVCRMPLMYGDAPEGAKCFIQPMIQALREGKSLKLFTDEYRTPLSASDAAEGLLLALHHTDKRLLHLGGPQRLSRYDIGRLLADALSVEGNFTPTRQGDVVMATPRAADVSMDSSRANVLGFKPKTVKVVLPTLACISGDTGYTG